MPLKYQVDDINTVPEAFRGEYTKDDATGKYRLAVEGAVAKERVDEFRTNNIALQNRLDELKDVDPKEYRRLLDESRKNKDKKMIDEGKLEELLNERTHEMKTKLEGDLNAERAEKTKYQQRLESVLIDSELSRAAVEAGCLETALDDIINRGRAVYKLKDDNVVPMKGESIVYGEDGETPMTMKEWLTKLAKTAPHLFKQSKGGGAAKSGTQTGSDISHLPAAERLKIARRAGATQ